MATTRIYLTLVLMLLVVSHPRSEPEVNLQSLIQEAEHARQRANALGHEWNTVEPLLEQGYTAMEEGDQVLATALFQEAKKHAMLAIEQAKYADEHWHTMVPK